MSYEPGDLVEWTIHVLPPESVKLFTRITDKPPVLQRLLVGQVFGFAGTRVMVRSTSGVQHLLSPTVLRKRKPGVTK